MGFNQENPCFRRKTLTWKNQSPLGKVEKSPYEYIGKKTRNRQKTHSRRQGDQGGAKADTSRKCASSIRKIVCWSRGHHGGAREKRPRL